MAELSVGADVFPEFLYQDDFTRELLVSTSDSSHPSSPGSHEGQQQDQSFHSDRSSIQNVRHGALESAAPLPTEEFVQNAMQVIQTFIAAEADVEAGFKRDMEVCKDSLTKTFLAVTHPQQIDPKHPYGLLTQLPFTVKTQRNDWIRSHEQQVILSSTKCSCCPEEETRPWLQLACLRTFVNSRKVYHNTTIDTYGNFPCVLTIPDGRVGQICAFVSSEEGIDVQISRVFPLNEQKRVAYGCARQDPGDLLHRFQIMFRLSGTWRLEASTADGHSFSFDISVATSKKSEKKTRLTEQQHAPFRPSVSQLMPPVPFEPQTLEIHSLQTNLHTSSGLPSTHADYAMATPGASPMFSHPLDHGVLFVQNHPSHPRDVPETFDYALIGHGPVRAMVDLHYHPTNRTRVPPGAMLPAQYITEVCDDEDSGDETPWLQAKGQTDWVQAADERDPSCFLKLELPPAKDIRDRLPIDNFSPSYQEFRARSGKIRVTIPVGRHQQTQNPAIEIRSRIRFALMDSGFILRKPTNRDRGPSSGRDPPNRPHSADDPPYGYQGKDSGLSRSGAPSFFVRYNPSFQTALAYTLPRGTALHAFALTRHERIIQGLIPLCPITEQLKNGATPLHLAAYAAPPFVFETLASSHDAESAMKLKDIHGFTPYDIAAHKRREHILTIIRKLFPHLSNLVALPQDLLINIGEHCDFETVAKFLLSCKAVLPGLSPFRSPNLSQRSCFYLKVSRSDEIHAVFMKVSELLQQNHVIFLQVEPDDVRFSPAIMHHFLGSATLRDRLSNIIINSAVGFLPLEFEDSAFTLDRASNVTLLAPQWGELVPRLSRMASHVKCLSLLSVDEYAKLHPLYAKLTVMDELDTPSPAFSVLWGTFRNLRCLKLSGWIDELFLQRILESLILLQELDVTCSFPAPLLEQLNETHARFSHELQLESLRFNGDGSYIFVAPLLPYLHNLTSLVLLDHKSRSFLPNIHYVDFAKLERLELSHAPQEEWLHRMTSLRSLRFDNELSFPADESSLVNVPPDNIQRLALCLVGTRKSRQKSGSIFISWVSQMIQLTDLELELYQLPKEFFEALGPAISALSHLTRLSISLAQTDSWFWGCLDGTKLSRLHTVNLDHTISSQGVDGVSRFLRESTSLKNVTIICKYLQPSQFAEIISPRFTDLRNLTIDPTLVNKLHSGNPQQLSRLQSLKVAMSINSEPKSIEFNLAESLKGLISLSSLFLVSGKLPIKPVPCLITRPLENQLSKTVFLRQIELTRLQFEDNDVEEKFGLWLGRLSMLTSFMVENSNLDQAMDSICTGLGQCGSLVSTSFSETKLSDKTVPHLLRLCQSLPSLSSLGLVGNNITATGAQSLVEGLATRGKLHLDLHRNDIHPNEKQLHDAVAGTRIKLATGSVFE